MPQQEIGYINYGMIWFHMIKFSEPAFKKASLCWCVCARVGYFMKWKKQDTGQYDTF